MDLARRNSGTGGIDRSGVDAAEVRVCAGVLASKRERDCIVSGDWQRELYFHPTASTAA